MKTQCEDSTVYYKNKYCLFNIIIEKGDKYYIAECPNIPGCISQGKTVPEAIRNIAEAVELCMEVREEKEEKWSIT